MKEAKESYFEDCNRHIEIYFFMSITNNHSDVSMMLQRNVVVISVRAPHIFVGYGHSFHIQDSGTN
jgi:hypothetical protein